MLNKSGRRRAAALLTLVMAIDVLSPVLSYGATSGPQQPEFASFTPVDVTDMVDPFTGDLKYSIPLLTVPGINGFDYPINLFYNPPTNMEEEASFVGYGWNLGIGAITRMVDVIPDDFAGDELRERTDMRKDWTVGYMATVSAGDIEVLGLELEKLHLQANVALTGVFSYNNHLGFGVRFALSNSIGASIFAPEKKEYYPKIGLNAVSEISASNLDGTSWNANLSLSARKNMYKLGLGYSKSYLSSRGIVDSYFDWAHPDKHWAALRVMYTTRPLSFPFIAQEYTGFNIQLSNKAGVELPIPTTIGAQIGGFYRETKLKYKNQWVRYPLFGSMYLERAGRHDNAIYDYKSEKEAMLRANQLNLGAPFAAPDMFVVSAQGLSGTFAGYRGDVGVYYDNARTSSSSGVTVSIEGAGGAYAKVGLDVEVAHTVSDNNAKSSKLAKTLSFGFKGNTEQTVYEPFAFKFLFEPTGELVDFQSGKNPEIPYNKIRYTYMGYDKPVSLRKSKGTSIEIFGKKIHPNPKLSDEVVDVDLKPVSIGEGKRGARIPRSKLIEHYTNAELKKMGGRLLPEMRVRTFQMYFDTVFPYTAYVVPDSTIALRHFGDKKLSAFAVVDEMGKRWNFGLPVVNYVERDVQFSFWDADAANNCRKVVTNIVANPEDGCASRRIDYKMSEKGVQRSRDFLNIRETPAYAKSFLLTSILGPNYVDINDNGPDYADKGNWIRFDYVRVTNDVIKYKWRTPFFGALYQKGSNSFKEDDQAFFKYGEREVYQIRQIVTPTHKAVFYYSPRLDNLGAVCWLQVPQDFNSTNIRPALSVKLDSIVLYAGNDYSSNHFEKIKKVGFCYDYSSWPGAPNVVQVQGQTVGKLTLRKLWFENYQSKRGAFTPYEFSYYEGPQAPSYDPAVHAQDRWGVYYPFSDQCALARAPYTPQFDRKKPPKTFKEEMDRAARWYLLKSVRLPSGAIIEIEYERDDYAWVGDRVAGQMFRIAGFKDPDGGNTSQIDRIPVDADLQNDIKIYFALEEPIAANDPLKMARLARYFEGLYHGEDGKQVFFKLQSHLLGPDDPTVEDVSGYGFLDSYGFGVPNGGKHYYAYFKLKPVSVKVKGKHYHPFLVHAWQNLKQVYRRLLFDRDFDDPQKEEEKLKLIWAVIEAIVQFRDGILGYYTKCIKKRRGARIDLDASYVRLSTPDQRKYGGGVRVKKIALTNVAPGFDPTPQYGFVYDYTTTRVIEGPSGSTVDTISSGVALNEPYIGSEENSYKYIQEYEDQLLNGTIDGLVFQEFPIHESVLPAPSVGYSVVTVRSLASDFNLTKFLSGNNAQAKHGFPASLAGIASTGQTVYEFYTTRDYPFVVRQTLLQEGVSFPRLYILPAVGYIEYNKYIGTQGYAIELNDMAGKLKSITHYGQKKNGDIDPVPVRKVEYKYYDRVEVYNDGIEKKVRRRLVNTLPVVSNLFDGHIESNNINGALINEHAEVGVTRQLFASLKRNTIRDVNQVGAQFNVDINPILFGLPLPTPTVYPNVSFSFTQATTMVFNKIVRRSGILKEVIIKDEQSEIVEENLKFDAITGAPLLRTTQNEFDNRVYTYTPPAYFKYYPMMPGYYNWGYTIKFPFGPGIGTPDLVMPYHNPCRGGGFESETYRFIIQPHPDAHSFLRPGAILSIGIYHRDYGRWLEYRGEIVDRSKNNQTDENFVDVIVHTDQFPYDKVDSVRLRIIKSNFGNKLSAPLLKITALKDPTVRYFQRAETTGQYNNKTYNIVFMDSVVHAEAYLYSDFWDAYPYMELHKGPIYWKSRGNSQLKTVYRYVADRRYDNLHISHQGIVDTMSIMIPEYQHIYTPSMVRWLPTSEIRRINEMGVVLTEENALVNQTALLDNYFTISEPEGVEYPQRYPGPERITARAVDAGSYEIAFTSFEDYEMNHKTKRHPNLKSLKIENRSHWNFLPIVEVNEGYEVYNIVGLAGSPVNYLITDKDWPGYADPSYRAFELYAADGAVMTAKRFDRQHFSFVVTPFYRYGKLWHRQLLTIRIEPSGGTSCLQYGKPYTDLRIALVYRDTAYNHHLKGVSIAQFGHSGVRSLRLDGQVNADTVFRFHQASLKLHYGRRYFFSCWINDSSYVSGTEQGINQYPDLKDAGVYVQIHAGPNQLVQLYPSGSRINGWQKVEGAFEYRHGRSDFYVDFVKGPHPIVLYVDDVRIHPVDSKMETYVYDDLRKRITEILDEDNYFTRFKYNAEGDLIAIEKETSRGVYTVQERIAYLKTRQPPECSDAYEAPQP